MNTNNASFVAVIARASLACAVVALVGCGSAAPKVDAEFGNAVRAARNTQTLNPNASANRDPVMGIDGRAGVASQERYTDGFKTPAQTFEVGGGTTAGALPGAR